MVNPDLSDDAVQKTIYMEQRTKALLKVFRYM